MKHKLIKKGTLYPVCLSNAGGVPFSMGKSLMQQVFLTEVQCVSAYLLKTSRLEEYVLPHLAGSPIYSV